MAIQHRRGKYTKFDPSQMVAGEWAVVQEGNPGVGDGKAIYMAFEPGRVKRMATYEDMVANLEDATDEAVSESTKIAVDSASAASASEANATSAAQSAESHKNAAASSATQAQTSERHAASSASSAAQSAQDAAAAAGSNLYSIGLNPETGRLGLYYNA